MRFLNPFSRSTGKTKARGGARRSTGKRKKTTARRSRTGINWRLVRWAVPATAIVALVGGVAWLWQDGWFGRQAEALQTAALEGSADMGLRIEEVLVEGRRRTDGAVILNRLGLARGGAILSVDPKAAQQALETLPWVRQASVERQLPDTIYIRLQEREPLALWQQQGAIRVIDQRGEIIDGIEPRRFTHLPLVVGPDAAAHAATLIAVVNSEPELQERVTAAVRVAGRRWNIEIEGRIDVRLPEDDAGAAWSQLAKIERQQGLLSRDVVVIDLRLPDRLVVRTDRENELLGSDKDGENT
ncbi:FtsQ-type POTRA domain-containing protein [Pelagibius litoralis]|uniref:Cell division protein FtsQ n=1 Tax=Pelagibius litoralis TaxID=374515 RepID=A0A967EVX6_9PROT|nr:FtsQ-type POTRA domain-containing protein [Pelagibius litoralis]NIA68629.1 FtsQ-type POTRA domain-containing protein [Pelagibius litoralis]